MTPRPVDSWDGVAAVEPVAQDVIFTTVAWEDADGQRHEGPPGDLSDTVGVFVHVTDPDNPDFHDYFWAWVGGTSDEGGFQDWAEWWVYIGALMEMYGMPLE